MRRLVSALCSALLAGCFSPTYSECPFGCLRSSGCPEGYTCDPARSLCCRTGAPIADSAVRELALDSEKPRDTAAELRVDLPPWETAPARELVASWDTDAEWATGQHARTQPKSGVLQLTLPSSSTKRGPKSVAEDAAPGGLFWYHGNVVHDPSVLVNGTSIYCDLDSGDLSRFLQLTDFNFALPAGALVNGVVFELARAPSGTVDQIKDESIRLIVGGARSGSEKKNPAFWAAGTNTASYGSSSDAWGLALDRDTVNAASFGCAVRVHGYYMNCSAWIKATPQLTLHWADGTGEWTSPPVSLGAGAKRWDSLETKQSAAPPCGPEVITYDVLDGSGAVLLKDLLPAAQIGLASVTSSTLKVRARMRIATKACVPGVDFIKLYQLR